MADALLIAFGCLAAASTVGLITLAAVMIPAVISTHWTPIYRRPHG